MRGQPHRTQWATENHNPVSNEPSGDLTKSRRARLYGSSRSESPILTLIPRHRPAGLVGGLGPDVPLGVPRCAFPTASRGKAAELTAIRRNEALVDSRTFSRRNSGSGAGAFQGGNQ
jgi:hypothetical protein